MDIKDIPYEVMKWFFEQNEDFTLYFSSIERYVAFLDNIEPMGLYSAYTNRRIYQWLKDHHYEGDLEEDWGWLDPDEPIDLMDLMGPHLHRMFIFNRKKDDDNSGE